MTMTSQGRDRLAEVRERAQAARKQRTAAQQAVEAANRVSDAQAEAVAQAKLDRSAYDVEVAEKLENVILGQVAGVSGGFDDDFLGDPAIVTLLDRMANTTSDPGQVNLGPVMSADAFSSMLNRGDWGQPKLALTGDVPDTVVGRRGPYSELGLIPEPRRRLRLLDLVPSSPAEGNTIPYIIESGSFDTAAETDEGAIKPVGDIGLTDGEAPVRTVAHWVKAMRQSLSDVSGLQATIQTRLVYGVLRRLENALVNGDGVGQNLLGILGTSGIGAVAYAGATPLADLSLEGLVAIMNSEAEPDACVMNATTLSALLTPKASTSGLYLNVDSPFGTGPTNLSLWGIPVIISTVMPTNQVLFGSFGQGARIWVREAPNVLIGLESDDLVRNKITILAEGRFGITIPVPTYFSLVHLA